jgi:hypothetical protein
LEGKQMMFDGPNLLKGSKRVVYVDLDEELDEVDVEIDVDSWLPRENLGVFCRANCIVDSEAACDQSGVIDRALCAQSDQTAVNEPLCSAHAVNDIARRWPPSEPYALADPSIDKLRHSKRRQNKERHSYAKALLHSDRELEKLSRKIRTEIQLSEMLELALEVERAANAGLLSFSAKPSTFGREEFPLRYSRSNVLRSRHSSEGSIPFVTQQIPSHKELKRFELRNVYEVIPPWKELHSQMRTHLFRRQVQEKNLLFCDDVITQASTPTVNPLDLSARSLAQNSLLFLENIADATISRIKKHPMVTGMTVHGASANDYTCQKASNSSMSNRTELGTTLTPHWSAKSDYWSTNLKVGAVLVHSDDYESAQSNNVSESQKRGPMTLLSMFTKRSEYRHYEEHSQGPGTDAMLNESFEPAIYRLRPSIEEQGSADQPTGFDISFGPQSEKDVELKSLRTRTPRRFYSSSQRNEGFETPVGLRDIRFQRDLSRPRAHVLSPDASRARSEPSSVVESCLFDLEKSNDGSYALSIRKLEYDSSSFLPIPPIGRSNSRYRCQEWTTDSVPGGNNLEMDLHVFPAVKSMGGAEQTSFLGSLESRETGFCEEKKESELCCGANKDAPTDGKEMFSVKLSVERQSDDPIDLLQQTLVHPNLRDPISCDLESGDDESSTWRTRRNTCDEFPPLLPPPSPGGFGIRRLLTRGTALGREQPLRLCSNTPKVFQNHGICPSFSTPDDNFPVAVEGMMAGLSPTSPSWRQQTHIGDDENDDFLTNYFYRTRHADDLHMKARRILHPCHDSGLSVDVVCSDIYHIFAQRAGGDGIENAEPRKRAVSLDARVPSASYHTSWLGAVQRLFSHCGSSPETTVGKSSSEQAQFDPPHLKKNTNRD